MMQEMAQEVENTAKAAIDGVHTALPGIVASFDPSRCTASVRPQGKMSTSDGGLVEYPTLTGVPVAFPCSESGDAGFAFPVRAGDSCIVIISEVELDKWRTGADPKGHLKFDLTSAMCVPGLLKKGGGAVADACSKGAAACWCGESAVSVSKDSVEASCGGCSIRVGPSGIDVKGDMRVDGTVTSSG